MVKRPATNLNDYPSDEDIRQPISNDLHRRSPSKRVKKPSRIERERQEHLRDAPCRPPPSKRPRLQLTKKTSENFNIFDADDNSGPTTDIQHNNPKPSRQIIPPSPEKVARQMTRVKHSNQPNPHERGRDPTISPLRASSPHNVNNIRPQSSPCPPSRNRSTIRRKTASSNHFSLLMILTMLQYDSEDVEVRVNSSNRKQTEGERLHDLATQIEERRLQSSQFRNGPPPITPHRMQTQSQRHSSPSHADCTHNHSSSLRANRSSPQRSHSSQQPRTSSQAVSHPSSRQSSSRQQAPRLMNQSHQASSRRDSSKLSSSFSYLRRDSPRRRNSSTSGSYKEYNCIDDEFQAEEDYEAENDPDADLDEEDAEEESDKRTHRDCEDVMTEIREVSGRRSGGRRDKPRKKHFPLEVRMCIDEAYLRIKSTLSSKNIFASGVELDSEAVVAFQEACKYRRMYFKPTAEIIEVIRDCMSPYRGGMLPTFRAEVKSFYHFIDSEEHSKRNIKRAQSLLEESTFTFKEHYPKEPFAPYRSQVISNLINSLYFKGKRAFGRIFNKDFHPIPVELIAWICTGIEHCIHEWSSGRFKRSDLDGHHHADVFKRHIEEINALADEEGQEDYVEHIRDRLYKRAAKFANLDNTVASGPVGRINKRKYLKQTYYSDDEADPPVTAKGRKATRKPTAQEAELLEDDRTHEVTANGKDDLEYNDPESGEEEGEGGGVGTEVEVIEDSEGEDEGEDEQREKQASKEVE